jgi:hypothetical protein
MRFILLPITLLALLSTSPGSDKLTHYQPQMLTHEQNEVRIFYENAVPLDSALRINEYLSKRYNQSSSPSVFKVPLAEHLYLVAGAYGKDSRKDYGIRFYLLEERGGTLTELYHSRGMRDSYVLNPTFFIGKDRVLIIADTGAEYSWGLEAFEFRARDLKYLGTIKIAKKVSEDNYARGFTAPLKDAEAIFKGGSYHVAFTGDLYLDPGGRNERRIGTSNSRVTFRYDGNGFKLSANSGVGKK